MRFGLVGTGPWAVGVHGPGLLRAEGVQLAGVWGRNPDKANDVAGRLGVGAFGSFEELLDAVDAVAFAVPPDVQAPLAARAAAAGRHLLLEKPVATSSEEARGLARTAAEGGVASAVFFTDRFSVEVADWFDTLTPDRWLGGSVRWLAALEEPGRPEPTSPWRQEKGALWDIGPHALSTMTAALGPVEEIHCVGGRHDLVHLVMRHRSGATSTAMLSLFVPEAAAGLEVLVWGEEGTSRMPAPEAGRAVGALARAAQDLARAAATGEPHPADLRLGVRIVELLEEAQRQL